MAPHRAGVQNMRPPAGPSALAPDVVLDVLVESLDDAVFIIDAGGVVLRGNQPAERILGSHEDGVAGTSLMGVFPPHLEAEIRAVLVRVMAGERVQRWETEIVRPDGMPYPISLSCAPVAGTSGVIVAALLIGRDITEQRLDQAALAEFEARVRASEALAHVGSWLWDRRTDTVQWSDEFHRIHGVDPIAFDGTFSSHLALVHPDDREPVRAALEEAVTTRSGFDAQYRIVRPDGEARTVRARARPTIGSDGEAVGLRGIAQDIT